MNTKETVLWGVKDGDEDWMETVLSTQPERFEAVKVLAAREGWGRFRIATIDLSVPPDFTKTVKRSRRGLSGMNTPWGRADSEKDLGDGVTSVSTPSHGGYHLDKKANAKVPAYMRRSDGWYEEDVDWAIVAVVFPHLFPEDAMKAAESTLRGWRPDSWERFFNMKLKPGQSKKRDEEAFYDEHKNDWIVVSAGGILPFDVPAGMVFVYAQKGGRRGYRANPGEARCFLIPEDEYRADRDFAFVVDETRHQRLDCPR